MDDIDAEWIKSHLTGERGEQARLAEAMGIDNDKMSKVLSGKRKVQAKEVPAIIKFFGDQVGLPPDPLFQELGDLWIELKPQEREFLRNAAKAQIAARGQPPEQSDED